MEGTMKRRLAWMAAVLSLAAANLALGQDAPAPPAPAAPSIAAADPIVHLVEVGGVDLSRMPPRPWHAGELVDRLLRKRSVILMVYSKVAEMRTLPLEQLLALDLGVFAQEVEAHKVADRLSILSAHRIRWEPADGDAVISLREKRIAVAKLPALLGKWGGDCEIK